MEKEDKHCSTSPSIPRVDQTFCTGIGSEYGRRAPDDHHHDHASEKLRNRAKCQQRNHDRGGRDGDGGVDGGGQNGTRGEGDKVEVVLEEARLGLRDGTVLFHPSTVSLDIPLRRMRQCLDHFAVGAECVVFSQPRRRNMSRVSVQPDQILFFLFYKFTIEKGIK